MNKYVVDASVAIKWFIPEIYAKEASYLQQSGYQLHAPAFFLLELGSVLCKKIRRQELNPKEGETILSELSHVPVQQHADQRLFQLAYQFALQTHRSLYDCLYLALAETIDGQMVTADRKFFTVIDRGPYRNRVLWVEDFPLPS